MADPRIPDTSLPTAASRTASHLVDEAPNATYHIVERVKGDQQVELCRVGGDGARGRECVQIAEDVTKVSSPFFSPRSFLEPFCVTQRLQKAPLETAALRCADSRCSHRRSSRPCRRLRLPLTLSPPCATSLQVFAFMQKQGFFCQLPFDPTHTEIGAYSWSICLLSLERAY